MALNKDIIADGIEEYECRKSASRLTIILRVIISLILSTKFVDFLHTITMNYPTEFAIWIIINIFLLGGWRLLDAYAPIISLALSGIVGLVAGVLAAFVFWESSPLLGIVAFCIAGAFVGLGCSGLKG